MAHPAGGPSWYYWLDGYGEPETTLAALVTRVRSRSPGGQLYRDRYGG
ncbi:MAG: hypothetical protein GY698_10260 [Actinomycetia bacterium]|nr:hypothetical protein [Actinomycetes bacterium]